MNGVSGEERLRPFPALDPEPPRRLTWRTVRWPALGCVIAAAVTTVVLLTWPSSSSTQAQTQARFTDGNGLVVFEQQPSGLLGTAAPDGSHRVMFPKVGDLQGSDLPVASSDGRYLLSQEGQLVAMGPGGPTSITTLPESINIQTQFYTWSGLSFADGSKYVDVVVCDNKSQYLYADLIPTAGGSDHRLGNVTSAAGDPQSAGAVLTPAPADNPSATTTCQNSLPTGDEALDLLQPGQPPHPMVTAAALRRLLGISTATPLGLSAVPNPDGSLLAVNVTEGAPQTLGQILAARKETVVVARTGKIEDEAPERGFDLKWSPDGRQIASCRDSRMGAGEPAVAIWTVGGSTRTITLRGHHDLGCDQLLWSPDGHQLIYSAFTNLTGLTQAAREQHGWTVIDLRSGQVHDVTAPGQPAAWLPVGSKPTADDAR
ncbi:MAG TPA: hypothetical protein VF070_36765 [Streptosporangiaceae bacterium]